MLTPAFNHLLRFNFVRCSEMVSKLIKRIVVSLLGTRVCGTSTEMMRLVSNDRDLGAHGHGKESLPETSRPGFISTVRPDVFQTTHRLEEEDTLGGIHFLRLKASHLRPKYRVLNSSHYALL